MTGILPTLEKPLHGAPCNGCGRCCTAEICPLGAHLFGREDGPCPALQAGKAGALVCGLVANPERYALRRAIEHGGAALASAASLLIGAGLGCDALLDGEPYDATLTARMVRSCPPRSTIRRAAAAWGAQI